MKISAAMIKTLLRNSAAWLLLGACSQALATEQKEKLPTICVGATENSSDLHYWQPAIGEGLAHIMTTELGKMKDKFVVLERRDLEKLRVERGLGESGEISMKESVKKGNWLGADYTFIIKVTRFGNARKATGASTTVVNRILSGVRRISPVPIDNVNFEIIKDEYEVQFDWRVVDNNDSHIQATGSATGMQKDTKFNINSWGTGGFSDQTIRDGDSAIGKACMQAVEAIVTDIKSKNFPLGTRTIQHEAEDEKNRAVQRRVIGSVLAIDGNEVWMSVGSQNLFKQGDSVKIYEPVSKKNSKGVVIATDFKFAGEIILKKVQSDRSVGIVNSELAVKEGWAVIHGTLEIDDLAGDQEAWLQNQQPSNDAVVPAQIRQPKHSDKPQAQNEAGDPRNHARLQLPMIGCLASAGVLTVGIISWKHFAIKKTKAESRAMSA